MFSRHRLTVLAATAIGAAAVGLATATASAGTVDDVFLAQLRVAGIGYNNPQAVVNDGHQICRELAGGKTGVTVAQEILANTDLTPGQAGTFVGAATGAYCPQLRGQLDG